MPKSPDAGPILTPEQIKIKNRLGVNTAVGLIQAIQNYQNGEALRKDPLRARKALESTIPRNRAPEGILLAPEGKFNDGLQQVTTDAQPQDGILPKGVLPFVSTKIRKGMS